MQRKGVPGSVWCAASSPSREVSRGPVERDTLYHPAERTENVFTVLV